MTAARVWTVPPRVSSGRATDAPGAKDAPAFTLGGTAPDAVVDAVLQRVLQAFHADRALGADPAGTLDTDAVGGEERRRVELATAGLEHPGVLVFLIGGRREIHNVACSNDGGDEPVPVDSQRMVPCLLS
jgi:hypothetical protein